MTTGHDRLLLLSLIAVLVAPFGLTTSARQFERPDRRLSAPVAHEVKTTAAGWMPVAGSHYDAREETQVLDKGWRPSHWMTPFIPPRPPRNGGRVGAALLTSDSLRRRDADDPRQFLEEMTEVARNRRPDSDPVVRYAISRGLIRRNASASLVEDCTDLGPPPQRPACR